MLHRKYTVEEIDVYVKDLQIMTNLRNHAKQSEVESYNTVIKIMQIVLERIAAKV